jgi:putative peptide zinc metalloprotease protein
LFLYRWLQPVGLGILAQLAATSLIVGIAANWTTLFWQGAKGEQARRRARAIRMSAIVSLAIAATAVILYVPFPYSITAPALIEPAGAHRVYVSTPGTLISSVSAGAPVERGQVLARLDDAGLRGEIAELRAAYERARTRVRHLEVRAAVDAAAAAELVVALEACADAEQRLNKRLGEERALTLTAPAPGTVIPPPAVRRAAVERQLVSWSGTPLEERNRQCFLERGTLLCIIGDPSRHETLVYVDGADVGLLSEGQRVRLQFEVGPAATLTGKVVEVAQRVVAEVPIEFVADSELASRADETGHRRPLRPTYHVRVSLDDSTAARLVIGARGWAKIEVEPQTLGQRIRRALRQALSVEI